MSKNAMKKKRKAGGDKTSNAEKMRRLKDVAKLLIKAVSCGDVVEFCCEKWGVCENTARSYILEANDLIKASYARDTKTETAKAISRYESLLHKSEAAGAFRDAASIQDRICKLLRLWEDVVRHEAGDSITDFLRDIRAAKK